MDSQKIRTALGQLQAEPDTQQAWATLEESMEEKGGDLTAIDFAHLLKAAAERHAARGEWSAVARLLEVSARAVRDTKDEAPLIAELAQVLRAELFSEERANSEYQRLLALEPNHLSARAALDESASNRARFKELFDSYSEEARTTQDEIYKSSMLMRAAELLVRFGDKNEETERAAADRLEQAVRLDPGNERAGRLLERIYRLSERWEELSQVLERLSDRSDKAEVRVAAGVRLARLYAQHMEDLERASRAYERVLRTDSSHAEARAFLAEFYAKGERWNELVSLYERDLVAKDLAHSDRLSELLQIAMLHWKKREKPDDAEAWFERVRKLDPTHENMLQFFREHCGRLHDDSRLLEILQGAQRVLPDGVKEKAQLGAEIARLLEGQANAQKAIDQYKSVLRQDVGNTDAREALKRLYKQTQNYPALIELLRSQLERTKADDLAARLSVLREVAVVYRQYLKSDTALLSVLNQIVQLDEKLDEHDVAEMRELVALYDRLGRHRDLITYQMKLAEITPEVEEKKELYRSAARRWLDQFSNAQNATDAYAALFKLAPDDQEARSRLEELYRKRRAWDKLYELYAAELTTAEGAARLALLREMAQLAAERLNRSAQAIELYKQIIQLDASRVEVLDALEKHAERTRDYPTLAEVLEKRVVLLSEVPAKLAILQKLGSVYADQMSKREEAASAWQRVLVLQPGHARAMRVLRDGYLEQGDYDGLERLYASQNDWEGLADVLSNAADREKNSAARIDLSYRAAAVFETKLGQPERAFRSYERILATDPADVRAARMLVPLYEHEEKWARLPALYELLGERADSKEDALVLLAKLVSVLGERLADRKTAAQFARRAYELAPEHAGVLADFEQAARSAGAWDAFIDALRSRISALGSSDSDSVPPPPASTATPEPKKGKKKKKGSNADVSSPEAASKPFESPVAASERRALELKLGTIFAGELGRPDDAVAVYRDILQRTPKDAEVAAALELLLRTQNRQEDLRWLFELRVTHASSNAEKIALLEQWAELESTAFASAEGAAALYRRILEIEPSHDKALHSLPNFLLLTGDVAGAAKSIAQHRDLLTGDARAAREADLAELCLSEVKDYPQALSAATLALGSEVSAARAMLVLDRLTEISSVRAEAARVLAEQYAKRGEGRREAQVLSVLLDASTPNAERLALTFRLADVYETKLQLYSSALDVILRAVHEFPSELSVWDRADALAVAAGRPTDLSEAYRDVLRGELESGLERELSERAARLHEDRLGDPTGAIPYLERVLEVDPSDQSAFMRLKDILTAGERWGEVVSLYDHASAATLLDSRRIEMLVEVALIAEEIIEDSERAIRYYERILGLSQHHEVAVRALDRLYSRQGHDEKLALLLEERLSVAGGEEIYEIKLRLARLQLSLHAPNKAVMHVEDVLRERVNDFDARELAERMLAIGSLRGRAARMLEVVYEARDEIRDLVRVLEIRLEVLDAAQEFDEERRKLLQRIATLRDERLRDDEGAFAALSRLVPLDPLDLRARERLIEIGRRLGVHKLVAEVLARSAERAEAPRVQADIWMQVASTFEDSLNDLSNAERVYRQVLALDTGEVDRTLVVARALERIYVSTNNDAGVVEMLRIQIKSEDDVGKKRELLGRLGALSEEALHDNQSAIEAWQARLEFDSLDERALGALDRLYETTGQYRALVEVLEKRKEIAHGTDQRRALMLRIAEILWHKTESITQAIDAYQAIVDEFGPSQETLRAIEALYVLASRWSDLNDAFERHLEIVDSDPERLELLAKLGDLRRDRLADVPGSLDAFRRALAIDVRHIESRAALSALLTTDERSARREAATTLRPIFAAEGDYENLLRVLSIEVETAEDPLDQLAGLEALVRVAEEHLKDPKRAYAFAERGVRTVAGHGDVDSWLKHLERLAGDTGRQREYVELLKEIAPQVFDGETQLAVTLRVANLSRYELGDRDTAREYYKKALELRAEDRAALTALESLYEETGDAENLLDILERRLDLAETDEERKGLLYRRGRLYREALSDTRRAILAYESILDFGFEPKAVEALESLYASAGMWVELISLYEREISAKLGSVPELHVSIAKVAAREQRDLGRAFDELEAALEIDKQHATAIAELERLMTEAPEAEHRARAATLLEPVYLSRADYSRVMDTIRARLEFSADPEERRALITRLSRLFEEQREDYVSALDTMARLLSEELGDDATVLELERLARASGAEAQLGEIYARELTRGKLDEDLAARLSLRAGEIFDHLRDIDRALGFYRKALEFEPADRNVFAAIDAILVRAERHAERVELYRAALDHRFEPSERISLLHTIAVLERNRLGKKEQAIETYKAVLDVDDADNVSLDALTELYDELERWDDLSDLYLRRAEAAFVVEHAADFRLALAKLSIRLGRHDAALDQLEEVVRALPNQNAAIDTIEGLRQVDSQRARVVDILRPLYEAADDWAKLVSLNDDRLLLAGDTAEKINVLRETADLWENRGHDQERARRAMEQAFELDPDDASVRVEYERLAQATKQWDRLTEVYEHVLSEHVDLASKRDVLATIARVHDQHRDDPRHALHAYQRLHAVDPSDLEPLERMEQLALLLSDWVTLVGVLEAKADLLHDDAERASIWRRIGEARRDMLDSADLAITAYERALDFEPDSAFTVDCLIDLYEAKADAKRLVELYQRRVELAEVSEDELKFELLLRGADASEKVLLDRPKAIEMLSMALALRSGDLTVLRRLNHLYRQEAMWTELLENLRFEAKRTLEAPQRAALFKEIGTTLAEKVANFDEAVEAYRSSLDDAPEDSETIARVRAIGLEHEELRLLVAEILVPVLQRTERYTDLVDVLEMRLSVESEGSDRSRTLFAIAEVLEVRLNRTNDALSALLRALSDRPEAPELHAEIERVAAKAGGVERYASALKERAQSTFEPELGRDLWVRLGRIAEEQLADPRRAVDAYSQAAEQMGDNVELLDSLDRLYTSLNDYAAVADVLERRVVIEFVAERQAQFYFRLAQLHLEKFQEAERGLSLLRMALERAPDHDGCRQELERLLARPELFEEVAEILESLYRITGRFEGLAKLWEKRVEFARSPEERADLRRQWARALEEDCHDPKRALEAIAAGVVELPTETILVNELERLASLTGDWERAVATLDTALKQAHGLVPEIGVELAVRLADWLRDRTQNSESAEKALVIALEFEPDSDSVLSAIEALQRAPGRELDLVQTLRRRGKLQSDDQQREEMYRQARELSGRRNDAALSEAIVRELLSQDENNVWALAELTALRARALDHDETLKLLQRRAELEVDARVVRELRLQAAELARDRLRNPSKATQIFEELFEDEPSDTEVAQALHGLYSENGQFDKLTQLLARLVDFARSAVERRALRLELARLNEEKFNRLDRAISELLAILEDEPGQPDAVRHLSGLYEKAGQNEELADLLSNQVTLAASRGDHEAELILNVRLGELFESRLSDRNRAISTYRAVLDRDPGHRAALDALARLLEADGDHAAAAQALERVLDVTRDGEASRVAIRLAALHEKLHNSDAALLALERGFQADEQNVELRKRLRSLYEHHALWEKLINLLSREADLAASEEEAVKILQEAARIAETRRQDHGAAADLLARAARRRPDDRALLLELSEAYRISGRGKAAAEVLVRIIESYGSKRTKELGEIHRRLANVYLLENEPQKALEELDRAFRIEPGNVQVLALLGDVALQAGDYKKAQQMFRALLLQKLDENGPIRKATVFQRLGEVHEKLGEKDKAYQMYERAVQADPKLEELKARMQILKS